MGYHCTCNVCYDVMCHNLTAYSIIWHWHHSANQLLTIQTTPTHRAYNITLINNFKWEKKQLSFALSVYIIMAGMRPPLSDDCHYVSILIAGCCERCNMCRWKVRTILAIWDGNRENRSNGRYIGFYFAFLGSHRLWNVLIYFCRCSRASANYVAKILEM